ncbi:MAG: RNA polymerase subunit sigma-24 [Myxococcaceae bacterium]|nr:RNA polymerase subunit sigma-24 [Myxococcaceae bacterium]
MSPTRAAIETVWRLEAPRLIGALARVVRDLSRAEDLAQDALVAALEQWPRDGVPRNPGAWLMAAARHRAVDGLRREQLVERTHADLAPTALKQAPEPEDGGDDTLRLMFIACHPVLSREARVALTLRLVAGLGTDELARAFLAEEATIAQRLVRAKRTLAEARVPFELPAGAALVERLPSVLEVLYLVFNEGYAASRGDDLLRPELCAEAMRLGRMLAARLPDQAEVHGLVALMELQASRFRARVDASGEPVLLADQRRALWDYALIRHGLSALARAEALGGPLGPYTLQAAIAACHARAPSVERTDWTRIVALYDALLALTDSPIVALNRLVAVARVDGAAPALAQLSELAREPALEGFHLVPAVEGDLLLTLGRHAEASRAFHRAATLATNARERALLLRRAADAARS